MYTVRHSGVTVIMVTQMSFKDLSKAETAINKDQSADKAKSPAAAPAKKPENAAAKPAPKP
ncbi:MAG: hypothetical protein RIM84_22185 [Alphaproteobacteria bacterium]